MTSDQHQSAQNVPDNDKPSEEGTLAGRGRWRRWKIDNGIAQIAAAFILVAGTAFVTRATTHQNTTPSPSTSQTIAHSAASVTISEPQSGHVTWETTLDGQAVNLQRGQLVWTFAQLMTNGSIGPFTYPTSGPCTVDYASGTWVCHNVYIGNENDTETYRVCVAILDYAEAFRVVGLLENTQDASEPKAKSKFNFWFASPPPYIHDNSSDSCMSVSRIN